METIAETNIEIVLGPHLSNFHPVCSNCAKKYSLDILCDTHRLPLRVSDSGCQRCKGPSRSLGIVDKGKR